MSLELKQILQSPEEKRNQIWENQFLDAIRMAKVKVVFPDPKPGPDSWPYLFVASAEESPEGPHEPIHKIFDWLSEKGIGLVLNAHKNLPDYIFTYGMIWNYREKSLFVQANEKPVKSQFQIDPNKEFYSGELGPELLPDYARKILKDFFRDQGILRPRVLMLSQDKVQWDICFAAESFGKPSPEEYNSIAEAISWFFPTHYSVVVCSEKNLPSFKDL